MFEQKVKKVEYERKIRQMDIDTYLKIQEKLNAKKELRKQTKNKTTNIPTGIQ